jgi:hypothetical protein
VTTNLVNKKCNTKIILLKNYFEYESNGINFVAYILYFADQISSQTSFSKAL